MVFKDPVEEIRAFQEHDALMRSGGKTIYTAVILTETTTHIVFLLYVGKQYWDARRKTVVGKLMMEHVDFKDFKEKLDLDIV